MLLVPFAGGWRADLQCNEDDDPGLFSSADGARAWVAATLGEKYGDGITWVSTYQFLQVIARSFVDSCRRVLLVGKAAHLFAPFGARGMNSGIADAEAASVAIAGALAADYGQAAKERIELYARERRGAAEWNRAAAAAVLEHLRAATPWRRVARLFAALAAPLVDAGRRMAGYCAVWAELRAADDAIEQILSGSSSPCLGACAGCGRIRGLPTSGSHSGSTIR